MIRIETVGFYPKWEDKEFYKITINGEYYFYSPEFPSINSIVEAMKWVSADGVRKMKIVIEKVRRKIIEYVSAMDIIDEVIKKWEWQAEIEKVISMPIEPYSDARIKLMNATIVTHKGKVIEIREIDKFC